MPVIISLCSWFDGRRTHGLTAVNNAADSRRMMCVTAVGQRVFGRNDWNMRLKWYGVYL